MVPQSSLTPHGLCRRHDQIHVNQGAAGSVASESPEESVALEKDPASTPESVVIEERPWGVYFTANPYILHF